MTRRPSTRIGKELEIATRKGPAAAKPTTTDSPEEAPVAPAAPAKPRSPRKAAAKPQAAPEAPKVAKPAKPTKADVNGTRANPKSLPVGWAYTSKARSAGGAAVTVTKQADTTWVVTCEHGKSGEHTSRAAAYVAMRTPGDTCKKCAAAA